MLLTRTHEVVKLLASGQKAVVRRAITARLGSETVAIGLRRDLTLPHEAPAAKIPLMVRPLAPGDDLAMLDLNQPGLTEQALCGRATQRRLLGAGLPTCWVAIGPDGKVCYMQWLIAPQDNMRITALWGDLFPPLAPHTALLEGAYTGDAYRGQGIMGHAMSRIADSAREFGVRWVRTFVGQGNIASLKGCKRAGFEPYVRRVETWRMLRRRVVFTPLQ